MKKTAKRFSLKSGLLAMILACWLVPIVIVLTVAGAFFERTYSQTIEQEIDFSAQKAMEQVQSRLEETIAASKSVSYDGLIRQAYQSYTTNGDRAELYLQTNDYLRIFTRTSLYKGVIVHYWEDSVAVSAYHLTSGTTGIDLIHKFQKRLYDAGYFPANTMTATDSETVIQFAEGMAAFLVDGSWKCGYFAESYPQNLENYVVCCVPGKGERPATDTIGGISMGYFITRKAWNDPQKRAAAVEFVSQLTSDETLSTFVKTEITALKSGAVPKDLNALEQSAADCNAALTGVVGAVQDRMSAAAKDYLFSNIRRVVTGKVTPEKAIEAALKLNG